MLFIQGKGSFSLSDCLTPESEDTTSVRKAWHQSLKDTAGHPDRTDINVRTHVCLSCYCLQVLHTNTCEQHLLDFGGKNVQKQTFPQSFSIMFVRVTCSGLRSRCVQERMLILTKTARF